jgi:hypothetical protein
MRFMKMFGLAMLAAVATMAFIGASSAMATSSLLCLNDTVSSTPTDAACNPPTTVHFLTVSVTLDAGGAELTAHAKRKLLSSGFPTTECDVLFSGNVLDKLVTNGPVRIKVTELLYTNCNNSCTFTVKELGTLLSLTTTAGSSGVAGLATVTGHNFKVRENCPFLFDCDYNSSGLTGHALDALAPDAGGKGHVTYTAQKVSLEEDLFSPFGSCPKESFLDALFQFLVPLYIRS